MIKKSKYMKYTTGALKDKKDSRDYLIKTYLKEISLPESLDLSGTLQRVRNQGDEGSCVSFAACSMKESQEVDEGLLSTRFLYEKIKQPEGGSYPRDACVILLNEGVCSEDCQKYIPNVVTPICNNASELSKQNKIKLYARLLTIDDMKQCLYQYGCFIISFEVYEGWINPTDGIVTTDGKLLGGHALCCCGFDDTKQLLKFKNSWGTGWGQKGYGYISYSNAMNSLYDAWKSIDIPEDEEKPLPPEPPKPKKSWLKRLWEWIKTLFS